VGRFGNGDPTLTGSPETWPEQLVELTSEYGISGYILANDDPDAYRVWGDVAAATRELVAAERPATSERH
ncbi:LLM class flavin-dependent oxidoreductase, partial [Actinomadura adrarensis]